MHFLNTSTERFIAMDLIIKRAVKLFFDFVKADVLNKKTLLLLIVNLLENWVGSQAIAILGTISYQFESSIHSYKFA